MKFKTEKELVDWIYVMHLQNTNGRETPDEMFKLGIEAAITELTDRELALRWWNRKSIQERTELAKQAKFTVENRDYNTLTGNEIEWIWRNQPYNS